MFLIPDIQLQNVTVLFRTIYLPTYSLLWRYPTTLVYYYLVIIFHSAYFVWNYVTEKKEIYKKEFWQMFILLYSGLIILLYLIVRWKIIF